MIKMPRKCINHPDRFCYVCGSFTPKGQVRSITHDIKKMYQLYFKCPLGDQDKSWAPHVICSSCSNGLRDWLNMRKVAMPFAVPMIWREPKNHSDDCYFCFVKLKGFSAKNKHKINYPELESAIRPVSHDDTLPVPVPPVSRLEEIEVEYEDCGSDATGRDMDTSIDDEYVPDGVAEQPERFTQHELNDLIRDLSLSKDKSELLASRLKQKNLLYDDVKVCYYRNRSDTLAQFFTVDGPMVYCNNVNGLFEELNQEYFVADWRLFIDSSQRSLKAVLLHNGNMKPSIPIAHSCHLKESYENMSVVLDAIQYKHHQWNICGDLKVIGLLMGMQGGFTKYCCFLCLWDSRNTEQHYVRRDWGQRNMYAPGRDNVQHNPLVDRNKIFLPPLHIKLGLIKNFVKAMAKTNSQGFQYISQKFSSISPAKLKEGVFVGPQIRELMRDDVFEGTLHDKELRSWKSFKWICKNFLGKNKSQEYVEGVEKLLNAYQSLGCRMSLKMHFLHSHLDFFPPNLGDVSDEQGERFHQDIKLMEHRYQGFWNESMMADYCWMLYRDNPETSYHRQSNVKHF